MLDTAPYAPHAHGQAAQCPRSGEKQASEPASTVLLAQRPGLGEIGLRKVPAWERLLIPHLSDQGFYQPRRLTKSPRLSQGGTLRRSSALFAPPARKLSQGGALRRNLRALSRLGRKARVRDAKPGISRTTSRLGRDWGAQGPCLGEPTRRAARLPAGTPPSTRARMGRFLPRRDVVQKLGPFRAPNQKTLPRRDVVQSAVYARASSS